MSCSEILRWNPLPIAANGTGIITGSRIGGFLAVTGGALSLSRRNEDGSNTALITNMPVTAGAWVFIPFYLGRNGGTVTLSGGASGIVGV